MSIKQLLYNFKRKDTNENHCNNFIKLIKKITKTDNFDHDFIFCINYIKLIKEYKDNIKMKECIKHNNLIKSIKNLSDKFLINQIFLWLIPDINNITFKYYYPTISGWTSTNYNYKYQLAENINIKLSTSKYRFKESKFWVNKLEQSEDFSKNKLLLSRICKKNEKHRYYITKETIMEECDVCLSYNCSGRYCRGQVHKQIIYTSKYMGNDLFKTLFYFYYP